MRGTTDTERAADVPIDREAKNSKHVGTCQWRGKRAAEIGQAPRGQLDMVHKIIPPKFGLVVHTCRGGKNGMNQAENQRTL